MRIIELSDSGSQGFSRRGYGRRSSYGQSKPQIHQVDNTAFLHEVLGSPKRTHFVSRSVLNQAENNEGDQFDFPGKIVTVSQFVQAAHQAFGEHVPLSLNPDVIWYTIVHEMAVLVKSDPRKYAHLFTGSPDEQKLIEVRDDSLIYGGNNDWLRSINLVRQPLRENMADFSIQLFLPTFSTSTPESETAVLVTFMDVVSKYYKFQWTTRCGIPSIRLEGDASDWTKLVAQTYSLSEVFTDLKPYFKDLLPVLQEIARTAQNGNVDGEFWGSLYKYNSESGGDSVTGWITAFFAYIQTPEGFKLKRKFDWRDEIRHGWGSGIATNHFSSHVSKVPFIWDYFGTKIPMAFAAGIFGVDYDGYLSPRLGFGVYEQ